MLMSVLTPAGSALEPRESRALDVWPTLAVDFGPKHNILAGRTPIQKIFNMIICRQYTIFDQQYAKIRKSDHDGMQNMYYTPQYGQSLVLNSVTAVCIIIL